MRKQKLTTNLLFTIIALLGLVLFPGCTTTGAVNTASSTTPKMLPLRVGVSTNAPPLIFKQGGQIAGLEADLARLLCKHLGRSLQFIELPWREQMPALLEGKIDIIMSGMSITRLRQVRIAFSEPYFRSGQMPMIRTKDTALFRHGFYSVSKSRAVGAVRGTTGAYYADMHFGGVRNVQFPTSRDGVKALINGDIDVMIHDAPMILYLASEFETKGITPLFSLLTEEYLAWGIRKDNSGLLKDVNELLAEIKKNGQLQQMIQQWIPFTD